VKWNRTCGFFSSHSRTSGVVCVDKEGYSRGLN
jgi:hypothetical protein